jgi:glycine hydroxymethyltransferase
MNKEEMRKIANLMGRIIIKKEDPARVKQEVEEMRRAYQKVHFAFEANTPAYKYIRVR